MEQKQPYILVGEGFSDVELQSCLSIFLVLDTKKDALNYQLTDTATAFNNLDRTLINTVINNAKEIADTLKLTVVVSKAVQEKL